MADAYPPGGMLGNNSRKKTDKHPDYTGYVEVDRAMLQKLEAKLNMSGRAKIELAGWNRRSAKGNDFISIAGSVWVPEEGQQPAPKTPPRGKDIPSGYSKSAGIPDDEISF